MNTNRSLFPRLLTLALVVLVGLLAVACGEGDTDDDSSGSEDTAAVSTTAGGGSSSGAQLNIDVGESSSGMYAKLDASTISAGDIEVVATNEGKAVHEVIFLKTDEKPADLEVTDGRVSEDTAVGEIDDIEAGKTKTGTITLEPGHYIVACNIPGHYPAGMRTELTVT